MYPNIARTPVEVCDNAMKISSTPHNFFGLASGRTAASTARSREKSSHCLSGAESGRPGPLEVETAELAGDVDDFSDEKKAGHFSRLHGLGREFVGIDAARGDFRFSVTLRRFRLDFPLMQLTFGTGKRAIGVAR